MKSKGAFMKDKRLNIEVLGIGFPNKGAELMLCAIQDWAAQLGRETRIVVNWQSPYQKRAYYGLWAKIWHPMDARMRVPYGRAVDFLKKEWTEKLGVVADKDIDLVLDASGYAYGDPWGARKAEHRLGEVITGWKRQGKKVVMLPQAFGPFQDPALRATMKHIIDHADHVYARDSISFGALQEITGERKNLTMSVDFSCLVQARAFEGVDQLSETIGLIPNHKMYEMGKGLSKDRYFDFFVAIAREIQARGRKVSLILHEGQKDLALCKEIMERLSEPALLVERSDPREIKAAIGRCAGVVTSRFHGFASSLFQGVPAFSTSWSHKYEEFAASFGYPEFVIKDADGADVARRLLAVLEGDDAAETRRKITAAATEQKEACRRMWTEVGQLLH